MSNSTKNYKRIACGSLAAVTAIAAGAAPLLIAQTAPGIDNEATSVAYADEGQASGIVKADAVDGVFSYDQSNVTPNSTIASMFRRAVASLCNATDDFIVSNPLQWKLRVTGDVQEEFVATVDELAQEGSVQQLMTCSCGSNPADGAAIINAEVKGIPVTYLLERANTVEGANAITFISSDGTEQMLPLGYVVGHHAVISYQINGEDLSASVGGNNQLWLTRTPASYFVRDIVEVRISKEAETPAVPAQDFELPNSPNAGITGASAE